MEANGAAVLFDEPKVLPDGLMVHFKNMTYAAGVQAERCVHPGTSGAAAHVLLCLMAGRTLSLDLLLQVGRPVVTGEHTPFYSVHAGLRPTTSTRPLL